MTQNFDKILSKINQPEPRACLFELIWLAIQKQKQLAVIKRRLVLSIILSAITGIGFVPLAKLTRTGFSTSGFWQFFSLIFSDFSAVIYSWQNYLISLLETLPVTNLILLLAVFLIFLEMLKFLVKNIKNINFLRLSS